MVCERSFWRNHFDNCFLRSFVPNFCLKDDKLDRFSGVFWDDAEVAKRIQEELDPADEIVRVKKTAAAAFNDDSVAAWIAFLILNRCFRLTANNKFRLGTAYGIWISSVSARNTGGSAGAIVGVVAQE